MKITKTDIPNILTSMRIVGAAAIAFIRPLSPAFFAVYTASGLSDVLDGFFARRWNCAGPVGARLDSIADLTFYAVMLLRMIPLLIGRLNTLCWVMMGLVLAVRLGAYITAAVKYRRFASMHTYANKLTGLLLFFLPYAMTLAGIPAVCMTICVVGMFASLEELCIHLRHGDYDPDRKSIFSHR